MVLVTGPPGRLGSGGAPPGRGLAGNIGGFPAMLGLAIGLLGMLGGPPGPPTGRLTGGGREGPPMAKFCMGCIGGCLGC